MCQRSLGIILDASRKAGFVFQDKKTVGPFRKIEFHRIVIDSVNKHLSILPERMSDILSELKEWECKKFCSKNRELLCIRPNIIICLFTVTWNFGGG